MTIVWEVLFTCIFFAYHISRDALAAAPTFRRVTMDDLWLKRITLSRVFAVER